MSYATALPGASIRQLEGRATTAELERIADWMGFAGARSLADTFPPVYRWPERVTRFGTMLDGEMISHAAMREVTLQTSLGQQDVALIGSVATAPEQRRRGVAGRLLQHVLDACEQNGLDAAILWSQHWDFYGRLGFEPCGRQWEFYNPILPGKPPDSARVRPAVIPDLPDLWDLHERKPLRVLRSLGEMARLLSTRGMRTIVLEEDGKVLAYACEDKGEDLRGWWHEFGGTDDNVFRLLHLAPGFGTATTLLLPDYRNGLKEQLANGRSTACALVRPMHRQLGDFFVDGLDSV